MMGNTKRALPAGWRWVKLGDVCKVIGGSTPITGNPDNWDGDIIWVTPSDLGKLVYQDIVDSSRKITSAGYNSSGTELLPVGSVVMSSRAPIGHLGIARVPLCTNQGCKSFVPGPNIISEFLYWSLKKLMPDIQALGSGATFAEVSKTSLQQFEIHLPPLPEQKRIISILNEQMATVERVRADAQSQIDDVKALPRAFLRQIFNSNKAHSWERRSIKEIARVQSGYAFKSEWFVNEGIRLLRNANVFQGYISWDDVVYLPEQRRYEFGEYELAEGEIVLSLDRPIVNRGLKIARLSSWDMPSLLLQRVGRFILNDGIVPEYLYAFLNSDIFTGAITGHDQSLGVPHISPKQVENVELPVPPLTEQRRIANILNEQLKTSDTLNVKLEAQLNEINSLPASLLRKAFNGEL